MDRPCRRTVWQKQMAGSAASLSSGGEMIKKVSFTETLYQDLPYKFEAGTQAIAEVIALVRRSNT